MHQKYLWTAIYQDNKRYMEFQHNEWNSFYEIEKDQLKIFGLFSEVDAVSFDVETGIFNIWGKKIKIQYDDYDIMRLGGRCEDIITFKSAFSDFIGSSKTNSGISNFNVGYKKKFVVDDIEFSVKFIYTIPNDNGQEYLNIRIVSDTKLEKDLIIYCDDKEVYRTLAPLDPHLASELNWIL